MDVNWAAGSGFFTVDFQTAIDGLRALALDMVVLWLLEPEGRWIELGAVKALVLNVVYDASVSFQNFYTQVILLNSSNLLEIS